MSSRPFGELPGGRAVDRFDLEAGGVRASVLTYGGILASLRGPDGVDVALGFDRLAGWLDDPQYFGVLVGRYANRIRGGRFTLDGQPVEVTRNRGDHHLHGGAEGFDKAVWAAESFSGAAAVGVRLRHHSPDGDEGFPGALDVEVTYSLDRAGTLTIDYSAAATAPTVVNLTNHVYLNLAGGGTVAGHEVTLAASSYLPVDGDTLPTGEIAGVAGTRMDLRAGARVGGGGYDHCFVVDGTPGELRRCAAVTAAGRRLEVATTQPGVQFYSGDGIRERTGRGGQQYGPGSGLCLETQHFPDSPNHSHFPSTRLAAGARFHEITELRLTSAT